MPQNSTMELALRGIAILLWLLWGGSGFHILYRKSTGFDELWA